MCSRAIRRIVRDKIYWCILWHQYQCTLYISTRTAILWSHGISFCRTLPVNFCGKCRITQLAIFRTAFAVKPYSTLNVLFFGTVAPPPPPTIQTLLSLFLSCCFVVFEKKCWLICWINQHLWWVRVWVFWCCRHAGTVFYVRCSWFCQGPLFFQVYSTPVLLLIYSLLHYDTASYGTVSITLYSTITTCVQVLLLDSCQPTTMILY